MLNGSSMMNIAMSSFGVLHFRGMDERHDDIPMMAMSM